MGAFVFLLAAIAQGLDFTFSGHILVKVLFEMYRHLEVVVCDVYCHSHI